MEIKKARGFNTVAVHGGELKIPEFGNVITPGYKFESLINGVLEFKQEPSILSASH